MLPVVHFFNNPMESSGTAIPIRCENCCGGTAVHHPWSWQNRLSSTRWFVDIIIKIRRFQKKSFILAQIMPDYNQEQYLRSHSRQRAGVVWILHSNLNGLVGGSSHACVQVSGKRADSDAITWVDRRNKSFSNFDNFPNSWIRSELETWAFCNMRR